MKCTTREIEARQWTENNLKMIRGLLGVDVFQRGHLLLLPIGNARFESVEPGQWVVSISPGRHLVMTDPVYRAFCGESVVAAP